jgi:hypothetical protein
VNLAAFFIFLLPLATMLLDLWVIGQGIHAIQFGVIGLGAERLAIERDQASHIFIPCFDNVLGGFTLAIGFAQLIAQGLMVLTGVDAMLCGAVHEGGEIHDRGLLQKGTQNPGEPPAGSVQG